MAILAAPGADARDAEAGVLDVAVASSLAGAHAELARRFEAASGVLIAPPPALALAFLSHISNEQDILLWLDSGLTHGFHDGEQDR